MQLRLTHHQDMIDADLDLSALPHSLLPPGMANDTHFLSPGIARADCKHLNIAVENLVMDIHVDRIASGGPLAPPIATAQVQAMSPDLGILHSIQNIAPTSHSASEPAGLHRQETTHQSENANQRGRKQNKEFIVRVH